MKVSSRQPFRLILHQPGNGRENMAVDEALMLAAGSGRSPATVRLYGFAPPTLSLGRFQRVKDSLDAGALAADGVTLVRRPTGGQAVLHDRELTYAVVLGRDHLEPFGKREIYRFIADLLLLGLERLGIEGRSSRHRSGDLHNPDCFRSTGEYEIESPQERKLIGSAQVLSRDASLQHGSIPLDGSFKHLARYLDLPAAAEGHEQPGNLSEALGREIAFPQAAEAFADGFRVGLQRLGIGIERGQLSEQEEEQAAELLRDRYSRDEWNLIF